MEKEKYKSFIDSLELIEEYIPEFSWERHIEKLDPKKKIDLNIEFKNAEPEITDNIFVCGNSLYLSGKDSEKNLQFYIKGKVLLRIQCNSDLDEECINFYSENSVQFSTIPTLRIMVKDALTKMGLPPYTLPFLKRRIPG